MGLCLSFTRRFDITDLEPPSDVKEMFSKYAEGGSYMTVEQLRLFLVEAQGIRPDMAFREAQMTVEEVLRRRHHIAKFTWNFLPFDDFFYYLFAVDLNPPFSRTCVSASPSYDLECFRGVLNSGESRLCGYAKYV